MADTKGHVDGQQVHQQPPGEEQKSVHISRRLRVLALDDNVACLKVLTAQLRECGYQVTATTEASEALELLRKNKDAYDIVITDVLMPDMDGFKLLEIIGLEWEIPVILTSADDDKKYIEKGIRHGARDYLVKPVRIEILQNIWQHVVRNMANVPNSNAVEADQTNEDSNNPNRQHHSDEAVSGQSTENQSPPQKKPRVVWEPRLHKKFLLAVELLDADKAVPKKILELMNEPNLTRENVASHLQKYRSQIKKAKERTGQRNPMDGMLHFYNPMMNPTAAAVGNHGLNSNYNNGLISSGHGMSSSLVGKNHPLLPINYNDIALQQRLLSEDVYQNMKNRAVLPVLHNRFSTGMRVTEESGFSAMRYPKIQNQRNMADHNSGKISSQLTPATAGPRYQDSLPTLIAGNSSRPYGPYPYSPVSFNNLVVPNQGGYAQPFPASNISVRGKNGHLAQPFPATKFSVSEKNGHLSQPFPATKFSVSENNGHLSQPFPATKFSVSENNGHLAQPFPATKFSVAEMNGHLALPFSASNNPVAENNGILALPFPAGSSVRQNIGHIYAQLLAAGSPVGVLNNRAHLVQPFPETAAGTTISIGNHAQTNFPEGISVRENNIGNHAQTNFPEGIPVNKNNIGNHAQTFSVGSCAGENNGHLVQPFPASISVGENNLSLVQPFPTAISVGENNGSLAQQPFPAAISVGENNGSLAQQPFPAAISVGENNGSLAQQPFPAAISVGENNGSLAQQPFPAATSVGENNGSLAQQPFPAAISAGENNGSLAQPFPPAISVGENIGSLAQQPFAVEADSSVRGNNIGSHAQPSPVDVSARENNIGNGYHAQTFPDNSDIIENSRHELELGDSPDDELSYMVKQFANYTTPSI